MYQLFVVMLLGDREVLDESMADVAAANNNNNPQPDATVAAAVAALAAAGEDDQDIIDHMIVRMQREQDERIAASGGEPLLSPRDAPSSPASSATDQSEVSTINDTVDFSTPGSSQVVMLVVCFD